jgi:CBS-domain-containing membrane protein
MNAADIMTIRVVTAKPDTGVNETARLMLTHRIVSDAAVDRGDPA